MLAYDRQLENALRFADEIDDKWGIEVTVADEPRQAVSGCDIVVTAGPILREPHATIQAGWLEPGAFASLVDFDSYWDRAALAEVDKFCTDDVPQLEHYQHVGYFQQNSPGLREPGRAGHRPEAGPPVAQRAHHDRQPGLGPGRHGHRAHRLPPRRRA